MEKKYLVMPIKKGQKNVEADGINGVVFFNLLPTVLWGLVFVNEFFKEMSLGPKIGIWLAFVVIYMACHFIRFVAFLPAIANTYLLVGSLWLLCNLIPNQVICIIFKVITAGFVGLFELSIAVMATIKTK